MNLTRTAVLAASASLLAATPALGMTSNSTPDGNRHPEVGAIFVEYEGMLYQECTGTLVSPTVVLTASHCTAFFRALGSETVRVNFSPTAADVPVAAAGPAYRPATIDVNPAYRTGYRNDVSVVVLSTPVSGVTPARIAGAGSVARLPRTQRFTAVG